MGENTAMRTRAVCIVPPGVVPEKKRRHNSSDKPIKPPPRSAHAQGRASTLNALIRFWANPRPSGCKSDALVIPAASSNELQCSIALVAVAGGAVDGSMGMGKRWHISQLGVEWRVCHASLQKKIHPISYIIDSKVGKSVLKGHFGG